jgi:uncharacterized FlaG/YvyC family protein
VVPVTGIAMSTAPVSAGPGVVPPVEAGMRQPNSDTRDTLRQSEAIEAMRAQLSANGRTRLQIEREEDGGRFIYKLMDPETGETLRRWPPESFGDLVSFLASESGGLVNEKA